MISTVVPIEQESTRALQLEEANWDKENKINELKVPGTAEVGNYLSLLLTQSFVQTCRLRCPQLTPTHTFPKGPWTGREAQLELVKEQFALEKKQEAKGKQCNLKGVITPRRSNLRMVQTECTRTVQSIACCILLEKSEIEFHEKTIHQLSDPWQRRTGSVMKNAGVVQHLPNSCQAEASEKLRQKQLAELKQRMQTEAAKARELIKSKSK